MKTFPKAASLRRRLSLLLVAERQWFLNPHILCYPSGFRSPLDTPSFPFPLSFSFIRSLSSSTTKRLLFPPHAFSLPSHAALSFSAERTDASEFEEDVIVWEEEDDDSEPVIGDGGGGGGIVLGDVEWGERALSLAREVLDLHFNEDLEMYAFKVTPRGYIYVRLDKRTNKYGCPSIEDIETFNSLYKKRLDEIVQSGEIPLDVAVAVSSPGAERLLRIPEDLDRFKEMPMRVQYLEEIDPNQHQQKDGVFLVEAIDTESRQCIWKLADVKENRNQTGKGRPLNKKQRDLRLQLPFEVIKKVTLYLS